MWLVQLLTINNQVAAWIGDITCNVLTVRLHNKFVRESQMTIAPNFDADFRFTSFDRYEIIFDSVLSWKFCILPSARQYFQIRA